MQRPRNERWERTKRYIIGKLFVDPGYCLSPVPEASDSSDERPYSPLPDLIIEREPNRHDESPEFYRGLEARMKRYYRRLFLDGATEADSVEYEGLINIDEDISEFDVNRSMASTFVIDGKNREDNEQNRSTPDEHKADSENHNVSAVALLERIQEVSKNIETLLEDNTSKQDENETNDNVNIGENRRVSNDEIHTTVETETDSNSTQDHHRISITVAQIHEVMKRAGPITRVFEGGSPVLIPRTRKFYSRISGALSPAKTNFISVADIIHSVEENIAEEIQDKEMFDKTKSREKETSLNQADEQRHFDTNIDDLNLDLEVENLMKSTEVSISTHDSIQTNYIDNHSHESADNSQSENDGEKSCTTIISNWSYINSEIDEEGASRDEESIGTNEYDYTQGNRTDTSDTDEDDMVENDDNSFEEMAVRRGIFVNKKNSVTPSSDEELASSNESDNKESESIEVMRRATHTEQFEALRRKSTMSQDSPLVGAFSIPVAAEFEEETSFLNKGHINSSPETLKETRVEKRSVQTDSTLQNNFRGDFTMQIASTDNQDFKNKNKASFNTGRVKESSIDEEEATPTKPANTLVTTLCDDIWSVSPIEINIADLSAIIPNTVASIAIEDSNKKKRAETAIDLEAPEKKRKKYQNTEVQTSAPIETCQGWEYVKTDFFVGKPLVFNLCSCQNHTCP